MNAKQKAKAIKLLSKDCRLRHFYVDGDETCAIGCLALAAGVSKARLREVNSTRICHRETAFVRNKIESAFGIGEFDLANIQAINDEYHNDTLRRDAVLGYVKRL